MKAKLHLVHRLGNTRDLLLTWELRPYRTTAVYIGTRQYYRFDADARRAAKRAAKRLGIEIVEER